MARNIKGITIEIAGNTTKLEDALKNVKKSIYNTNSELKDLNKALKLDPKNTELLAQKQDVLKKNIQATTEKLETLKKAQKQMGDYSKLTDEQKESYRALSVEIAKTEDALKKAEKELKNFVSVKAQQIEAIGESFERTGQKVQDFGKKTAVASGTSAAALTLLSKGAIDFESAFAGVLKTVDGTDKQLEEIRQGILNLSKVTASSSKDIASVAEAAGQLGVATENILDFTETMVRLGDSTNLSADEAAIAIAQLYNVMQSDINSVDRFGASLVALGNNAATTEKDILEMATRIASSGKQVGMTEQQVLALATSLASVGLEAQGGGSAISAIMTQIDKDVALNTDTLATWASLTGKSTAEFKKLWQTDVMGAMQAVTKGMGDAKKGGENLNVVLDELGIKNIRQTDAMKRLSNASELLGDMVNLSNEAWEENSALIGESDKRYNTTAAKIQQMKNSFTELSAEMGTVLLPVIKAITTGISKFAGFLSKMGPVTKVVVVTIMGLVAVLSPLAIIIGTLIEKVGIIIKVLPKLKIIITTIGTGLKALWGIMMANPIILIVAAIAALVAAFVILWKKSEKFRNFWKGLWEGLKNIVSTVTNFIKENWKSFLLMLVNPFAGVFKLLYDNVEGFRNFWNNIWTNIKDFFINLWEGIVTFFSELPGRIMTFVNELPEKIGYALGYIAGTIAKFFVNVWEFITVKIPEIITQVITFIKELPGKIWEWLTATFNKIKEFGSQTLQKAKEIGTNFVTNVVNFVKDLPGKVWGFLKNTASKVASFASDMASKGKTAAVNLHNNIVNGIQKLPSKMLEIGKNLVKGLWNGITGAASWLKEKIHSFGDGILKGFKKAFGIKSPSKLMRDEVGKYIGLGVAEGIDDTVVDVENALRGLTTKVETSINPTINPTANSNPLIIQIENFNNERGTDIQTLAEELEFYRKNAALARGGN